MKSTPKSKPSLEVLLLAASKSNDAVFIKGPHGYGGATDCINIIVPLVKSK